MQSSRPPGRGGRRESITVRRPFGRLTLVVAMSGAPAVVRRMGASAHSTKASAVKSGGTLTIGWAPSFGVTDNFDPTGEYLGDAWGVLELEVRTLVNYQHLPGAPGNKIVPDLASSVPVPSNGGKT